MASKKDDVKVQKFRTVVASAGGLFKKAMATALEGVAKKATQVRVEARQLGNTVKAIWHKAGKPTSAMPITQKTQYREFACCVTTLHRKASAPALYVGAEHGEGRRGQSINEAE